MKRLLLILVLVLAASAAIADMGVKHTGMSTHNYVSSLWDVMSWGSGTWG